MPDEPVDPMDPARFVSCPRDFVGISSPELVYIGVRDREKFDSIALPVTDHGVQKHGHVLSKQLGSLRSGEVTVIFQHWLKSLTVEAMMADAEQTKAFKAPQVG
jgi:hypothetical protein